MTKNAPLELSGTCSPTGWEPPADLPEAEWRAVGVALGKLERSIQWLVGDWWIYGEERGYGVRKAMTEDADWEGPSFQTCMNCATVARAFAETYRRREVLTFAHHAEVASLPQWEADVMLAWCEETTPPHSVRELRERLGKHRVEYTSHTVKVAPRKVEIVSHPVEATPRKVAVYTSASAASSAPKFPRVPEAPRAVDPPASPPAPRTIRYTMTLSLAPDNYDRLGRYAAVMELPVDEALERLVEEALERVDVLVVASNANSGPRH
jgi:hypothetical protein